MMFVTLVCVIIACLVQVDMLLLLLVVLLVEMVMVMVVVIVLVVAAAGIRVVVSCGSRRECRSCAARNMGMECRRRAWPGLSF